MKPPALEKISSACRNQLVGSVSLAKLPLKIGGAVLLSIPPGKFSLLSSLAIDLSYTPRSVGVCTPVAGSDKAQWFF